MYNSQYYTCEQIDERLLQGYLDDYNQQNNTNLSKAEFLTLIFNTIDRNSTVDNLVTQVGYYECDTAAGTAAKVLSVASYDLFVGGSMKVKFANKNTANNATLNINSNGAKALYYQGERASSTHSWDAGEVVEIYYDGTSYYANNVKGGSSSGVYDVSKEHPTSGPNSDGKFTLEYILNSNNVNELIPVNKRYPGMSIQFVSTSDNKYVQYRLVSDSFNTTPSNWQKSGAEVSVSQNTLTTNNKAKAINVGGTDYNITDQDAQEKISQLGQGVIRIDLMSKTGATALSSGADLNNVTNYGIYSFLLDVSQTLVHAPLNSGGGYLIVEKSTPIPGSVNWNRQTIIYGSGKCFFRFLINQSGATWTNWESTSIADLYNRDNVTPIASGTDLNSLSYGAYSIANAVTPTLVHSPISSGGGMMNVVRSTPASAANYRIQILLKSLTCELFIRTERSDNTWNEWIAIASQKYVDDKCNDMCDDIFAFSNASEISANTDLNDVQGYGVYSIASNVSPTLTNAPRTSGGAMLLVSRSSPTGTSCKQTINYGLGYEYYRYGLYSGSTSTIASWTEWMNVAFEYNVSSFGAKGDGTTDDASAIQNAFNAAINGGVVYFPAGTYAIKTNLYCHSNTKIVFSKGATLLRNSNNVNCILRTKATETTLSYDGAHDITIIGGTFDGNTGFTQGCGCISTRHAKNIKIIDCCFKRTNVGFHCIEINSSKNVIVENCVFSDLLTTSTSGEAVQIDGAIDYYAYPWDNSDGAATNDGTVCNDIEIKSCTFSLNAVSPAIGNHANLSHKYINIHDCTFENVESDRGTINFVASVDYARIHDNMFKDCSKGVIINNQNGLSVILNNMFVNVPTPSEGYGQFVDNFTD